LQIYFKEISIFTTLVGITDNDYDLKSFICSIKNSN